MPDVSRRTALKVGAGAAGLLAIAGPAGAAEVIRTRVAKPVVPVRSHFSSSIGQPFTAIGRHGRYRLTLAEILDVTPLVATADEDRFNLIFEAVTTRVPEQGIYLISRPGVHTTELFVSPVGATSARRLQALVNRSA